MFWRAGYRLFHGNFLSFMSCPRGIGTFVNNSSSSRKLNPELTDINFEVPSRTSILDQNNNLVPNVIHPGVINESLDAVKSISNINMMCVDGKKVTAGLDEDFGDVNVFGFGSNSSEISFSFITVSALYFGLSYVCNFFRLALGNDSGVRNLLDTRPA